MLKSFIVGMGAIFAALGIVSFIDLFIRWVRDAKR